MLIGVVAIIILTFISMVVLVQGPKKITSISLAVTIFVVNAWILSIYGLETSLGSSNEYARLIFALGLVSLMSLLWFVRSLLRETHTDYSKYNSPLAIIGLAATVVIVTLFTDLVIEALSIEGSSLPVPQYGSLFSLYLAAMLLSILSLAHLLAVGATRTQGTTRSRNRAVTATVIIAVLVALTTNLLIPTLQQDTQYAMLAPLTALVLSLGLIYAIVKYGLFDIRLAAVRTVAYVLSVLVIAGVYFGLAYVASRLLFPGSEIITTDAGLINIAIAFVLAFIFQPVRNFFDLITNKLFFRNQYNPEEFIGGLGDVLASTTDIDNMLKWSSSMIRRTMKSEYALFVVFGEYSSEYIVAQAGDGISVDLQLCDDLRALYQEYGGRARRVNEEAAITVRHHDLNRLWEGLQDRRIALLLPLREIGFLLLGERQTGNYSKRDLSTLDAVSGELVIAIQNARSVQEVRALNATLQERIKSATQELQLSNDKLRELDTTKDEFLSMASHQLRTPLTSVKGYISMVLDGDVGEVNDQQRKLLNEAFASSERMVRLIGDFLNVSRLQTGKFSLERKSVNLAELIAEEVESIDSIAAARDITLTYLPPEKFPLMDLDEDKIRQVVMNFLDNAIYYSRSPSTVAIKLYIEDKQAVVEVHDRGIGVPKEALGQLFTKFYRADNARRQRPDGTGVGLYLAKRVVVEHGGELIVDSTEGKGSVFGFRLPIK